MSVLDRIDPFTPVLLSSSVLEVSLEQTTYIKAILDLACSDSRFSEKAYVAILQVLTGGSVAVPVVSSLVPNSAELGSPSFVLHVHGTNLKVGSIIVFAGQEEPTTHVSNTEVTTGVDMSVWLGPDVLPVQVLSPEGILSNSMDFTFVAPGIGTTVVKQSVPHLKTEEKVLHPKPAEVKKEK